MKMYENVECEKKSLPGAIVVTGDEMFYGLQYLKLNLKEGRSAMGIVWLSLIFITFHWVAKSTGDEDSYGRNNVKIKITDILWSKDSWYKWNLELQNNEDEFQWPDMSTVRESGQQQVGSTPHSSPRMVFTNALAPCESIHSTYLVVLIGLRCCSAC